MQHDTVLMHFAGDHSPDYSPEYATCASPAEFTKVANLVLDLLYDCARVSDDGNTVERTGVEPGSPREREARSALAWLLHATGWEGCGENVKKFVREEVNGALAYRLDPDNETDPFELRLSRRRGQKGPAQSESYDRLIARYISINVAPGRVEAAIAVAMDYFGISRAKAYDAWEKYRHAYEEPLPAWAQTNSPLVRAVTSPE
jgi:hypothetical protein